MKVNKIIETALGFDKSRIIVEMTDGRIKKINLKRDKKRFNEGNLNHQYYFLNESKRIYVDEIHE